jgi:pyrroloquinoline quinone biosynthesis protein E
LCGRHREEKVEDVGGCRCQACLLTGDPENADPIFSKSPDHRQVVQIVRDASVVSRDSRPILFRNDWNSTHAK